MIMPRLLRNELENVNRELATAFDQIYGESLRIWEEQYLWEYTTHGKRHTEQVERNLDSLTRPLQSSTMPLNAQETFVLLSATCLHDIGMQRADDPDARRKHAQYAFDLIVNSHARFDTEERRVTLPINDRNARVAIANVARAHWTEYALELPKEEFIDDQNNVGRLRLLGLLLAMADLLDLSPVRARYFRSIHRLYELPPVSELHQTMHDLVKGVRIQPKNPNVPGALLFRLEWFDNSEMVRTMNDWIMQWFNSQWWQLHSPLYEESGGAIGWARPWAHIVFNSPQGPVPTLSAQALNILNAERAEQTKINRNTLTARYREAIELKDTVLFLFPADSNFDWRTFSEWCEAHARLVENCRVARISIRPSLPAYFSGIISQLMEQWGEHLSPCSGVEALKYLEAFVTRDDSPSLVSIIRTDEHVGESLQTLIGLLLRRSTLSPAPARVCLLISLDAEGPKNLRDGLVIEFDGSLLPREEVEQHLHARHGYSLEESSRIYETMLALKLTNHPAQVYTYIDTHCGLEVSK